MLKLIKSFGAFVCCLYSLVDHMMALLRWFLFVLYLVCVFSGAVSFVSISQVIGCEDCL